MKKYRIFISHSWKYYHHYDRIFGLLNQHRNVFDFADYSIPREYALDGTNQNIWDGIDKRIAMSHALLIPAAVYVTHSESIRTEIEIAKKYKKPIIAIKPRENDNLSLIATQASWIKPVGWNGMSIIKAFKQVTGLN